MQAQICQQIENFDEIEDIDWKVQMQPELGGVGLAMEKSKSRVSVDSLVYFPGIWECLGLRFCVEISATYYHDFSTFVFILF